MKETNFIKQNKDKWKEFEQVLDGRYSSPEKMHDLFVQITDDLSYSRTYYPNRSVRVYLNSLAQRIFFRIYSNRKSRAKRLLSFWSDDLPRLMHESRHSFLLAFVVFVLSFLIGMLSSAMDTAFATLILGEDYVAETLRNIDNDDPMAIYKGRGRFDMFLGITINNLWVAFLTFVLGVTYIGSIGILIRNGIMVGVFQYFFIARGLFWESFLTIWIHGTLEISAIIIAGGAGLTMGSGLIFPGTYRRMQAFQQSARRGLKIMIGIAPIIILAGFFEGFLTRNTNTPNLVRGLFIFACLTFVIAYFIVYPWIKSKIGFGQARSLNRVPPDSPDAINFQATKNSGSLFADIFSLLRKYLGAIVLICLACTALFATGVFLLSPVEPAGLFVFPEDFFASFENAGQYFYSEATWWVSIFSCLMLSFLVFGVQRLVRKEAALEVSSSRQQVMLWLKVLFGCALLLLVFLTVVLNPLGIVSAVSSFWYISALIILVLPVFLLWLFLLQQPQRSVFVGLKLAFRLLQQRFSQAFSLMLILFFLSFLFISISDTVFLWFFLDMVSWVVHLEEPALSQFSSIVLTVVAVFVLNMVLTLFILGGSLLYFSLLEIFQAQALRQKIQEVGIRKTIRGIQKEASV
ncbi:MAG: stage II sporulation protein M [Bacteroidota bacterium]